jgi:hypothetical protein
MSYEATDDLRAAWQRLDTLNDHIDQIAAEASDVEPIIKRTLDLACYYAEDAMRQIGHGSCGHVAIETTPYCAVCAHYQALRTKAELLRGRL